MPASNQRRILSRRKLIEGAAGNGGREAPVRNLMPPAGYELADVSRDFWRQRRKRRHRHRLFIAEAGEHAMERSPERVQILPFRRSTAHDVWMLEDIAAGACKQRGTAADPGSKLEIDRPHSPVRIDE